MAGKKRPEQREQLRAKTDNPFIHIPFSRQDLGSIERNGGGGKKVLVSVDDAYRRALSETLQHSVLAATAERDLYPDSMFTLVFKLREKAIAKSHRPMELAQEARLQPAGHAKIDEMLVGATASSAEALNHAILKRNTGTIRANLSAIEAVELWSRERRNPEGASALLEAGRAVMSLFRYAQDDLTKLNYDRAVRILKSLSLQFHEIHQSRGLPLFLIHDLDRLHEAELANLLDYPGARQIYVEPVYEAYAAASPVTVDVLVTTSSASAQQSEIPTVAIFDTGVSSNATAIAGWVPSRDIYVLPPDTDHVHGTMVASLISAASHFNNSHPWLPLTQSFVHDVCALEVSGSYMSDLEERLREAVSKRPDIKVWNLSLGGQPCDEQNFSDLAMTLDELSDRFNVLFVVAAGNYVDMPRRGWPNPTLSTDRVSTPGESVRALTVASVSHIDASGSLSAAGDPAPYSRRGPGPVFTPKPDISHVGGGVHAPWKSGGSSLAVLTPQNNLVYDFGTSFAAPIASSMAAHAWQSIAGRAGLTPTPSLVKALMIHAAQLSSPAYDTIERRYFGAGRPDDILRTLYDSDDSFTLVFQAEVVQGMKWRKTPYPIPSALMHNGKFRGEIIITAAYAPPLDPSAGSEYVRANIELSFGKVDGNTIKGMVPMEGEEGQSGYESAQVEHGSKWSPIKVHRTRFPNGVDVDQWGLQASVVLRAYELPQEKSLPVSILVTLRALDGNPQVRSDGLRELNLQNWIHSPLPIRVPVRT